MRRIRKFLVGFVGLAGLLVVIWLVSSWVVASRMTRRPFPVCEEPVPTRFREGTIRSVRLSTADGERLGAWFLAGPPNRPLVLLLHGNGRSRSSCLEQAELASQQGYSVLMLSLRAHGDSTGEFNDFGLSARLDVLAAVAWLEEHHPGRPIVLWGQSLGAAAAVFAAEELGERVRGYILECPYRDLRSAVRNRTRVYLTPVLDHIAYAGLLAVSPLVIADLDRVSPLDAAGAIPSVIPILILAGDADKRATLEDAQALVEKLGDRAQLVTITGGDHLQLSTADPTGYRDAVLSFLAECTDSAR